MLVLSRAGQAAGLTFNQTSESLTALVNAGVRGGEQFEAISQSVGVSSASGVEVDKVAEAFGKLTTDPTSGLTAMARQFHNVTAEQIAYVAQLQRSGDEAGALQAANEAATKGFDDQTRRLKEEHGHAGDLGRQDSTGIQIHVGFGAGYWSPGHCPGNAGESRKGF